MQQNGSKYNARIPLSLGMESNDNHECSNMVANILPAPPDPKGQNLTFLEHVAYQINCNYEMKQHGSKFYARTPPPLLTPGLNRSQFNFFITISCCIPNQSAATWSQIFCLQTAPPLTLALGSKGHNSILSERDKNVNRIKGNRECSDMLANFLPTDPLPHDPRDEVNRSKFNFFRTRPCCISN